MDTQIKKEEADNEEKDRSAEVQKFIGPSKGHCSIWTCDQAFQHLLSSKAKRQQGHQRQQKNTKKTKAPSKALEMSIMGLMVSSQPGGA